MSLDAMKISKFVTKNQPWTSFFIKLSLLISLMLVLGCGFINRYKIGIDPQNERCLPNNFIYLIDLKDLKLERNATYAFHAKGLSPLFKDGTRMLKILVGLPGDTVEINKNHEILVNGKVITSGLQQAERIGKSKDSFIGKAILKQNELWFLGESINSFDSRYWGAAKKNQLIGRAYAIY